MPLKRVCVAGLGLIGASLARAIKQVHPAAVVEGVDLPGEVARLRHSGIADRVESLDRFPEMAAEADLIVLAAPVQKIPDAVRTLAGVVKPSAIVTDVGGVKGPICKAGAEALGGGIFIGGHPMSGSERAGGLAADPLLFQGRSYILCPLPGVDHGKLLRMVKLVEDIGGRPITLDPADHDRLVGLTSHLPQLIATTIMHTILNAPNDRDLALKVAGRGFRDLTRVAASDLSQWRGVLDQNRKTINAILDEFEAALAQLRSALNDSPEDLAELWSAAAAARRRMVDREFKPVGGLRPSDEK
ncbi:MAG: prephenate dehydrogenase/arogenate dehydrogenase family protein [Deltaproteobacteria bacterium]|nr:prephenate dehydrogenase/arogenate dehydrogenase family protein [Deltaproteobacteria bacterium]